MIEYMRQEPPDEYGFCENCQARVDAGDMKELDTKWYCENCIDEAKDATIPEGMFCELPDGYRCEWVHIVDCTKFSAMLVFDADEFAWKKCTECVNNKER